MEPGIFFVAYINIILSVLIAAFMWWNVSVSIPTISLGLIINIGILHRKEAARKMGVNVAYVIAALCVILLVPSGGGGTGGWIIILAHFWWAFATLLIWQLIVIRILDKESVKAYFS